MDYFFDFCSCSNTFRKRLLRQLPCCRTSFALSFPVNVRPEPDQPYLTNMALQSPQDREQTGSRYHDDQLRALRRWCTCCAYDAGSRAWMKQTNSDHHRPNRTTTLYQASIDVLRLPLDIEGSDESVARRTTSCKQQQEQTMPSYCRPPGMTELTSSLDLWNCVVSRSHLRRLI
jgi:hypothetical protein